MRPEVAPLLGYAQQAIRRSLEKRMPQPVQTPGQPEAEQLSDEDKAALEAHYAAVK